MTPCLIERHAIVPAYSEVGAQPALAIWREIPLERQETCSDSIIHGPMKLVVALAGSFEAAMSWEQLAARVGEVSSTEGLLYWSSDEARWRKLISKAFALRGPEPEARRPDFTAAEVLSGRTLYFAQKDTRSTSLNVYSLSARKLGADRLVVEIVNLTPIRFIVLTMFEPRSLISLHFFERRRPGIWNYYGLSAVREGLVEGFEASVINRAAAFHRYVRGVPGDAEPPLAP